MMSVLLLTFTVSPGFISNGYQKVYGAVDFPTSDFGTKIRDWINNQITEQLSPPSGPPPESYSEVKVTVSGFPDQTGQSVINVPLTPSPCQVEFPAGCKDTSQVTEPYRLNADVTVLLLVPYPPGSTSNIITVIIIHPATTGVPSYSAAKVFTLAPGQTSATAPIDIRITGGGGSVKEGQETIQLS
jgi:hypothetical protein